MQCFFHYQKLESLLSHPPQRAKKGRQNKNQRTADIDFVTAGLLRMYSRSSVCTLMNRSYKPVEEGHIPKKISSSFPPSHIRNAAHMGYKSALHAAILFLELSSGDLMGTQIRAQRFVHTLILTLIVPSSLKQTTVHQPHAGNSMYCSTSGIWG